MANKKKCFIGPAFDSFDVLLDWIDSDFWVFIRSRAYHPSFVRNRMLGIVREERRNGTIRACYDVNGEPYWTLTREQKDIIVSFNDEMPCKETISEGEREFLANFFSEKEIEA